MNSIALYEDWIKKHSGLDYSSDSIDLYEIGNLGYLALKEGRNPLNTSILGKTEEDIDKNDYVTIVPLQDELYSKLQTLDAQYTEIIEVWEIRLDFIDDSNKIPTATESFVVAPQFTNAFPKFKVIEVLVPDVVNLRT